MGASVSTYAEIPNNIHLKRFISQETIPLSESYWETLLSFKLKFPSENAEIHRLDALLKHMYKSIIQNNTISGNVATLIQVYLSKAIELKTSDQSEKNSTILYAQNGLLILRHIVKILFESLPESDVIVFMQQTNRRAEDMNGLLEHFIASLVEIIVDIKCTEATYFLHVEACKTILTFLSSPVFDANKPSRNIFMRMLLNGKPSIHACVLIKTLLLRLTHNESSPSLDERGGIITGFASGLWSVLTLGLSNDQEEVKPHQQLNILAQQSLLLLLVLVNNCVSEKGLQNPFRIALLNAKNYQCCTEDSHTKAVATFKINFSSVYRTLVSNLDCEQITLLLYILLHKNEDFRIYILSRTDVESLLLPILKTLYNASSASSYHIYMSLIILLILSEDDSYNKMVHDIKLKNISWLNERSVNQITLGSLLVLVVIRTIIFNMTKMRDKYLHTNCLAALANMSNRFHNLHLCTSQKIINLFEILAKRYTKMTDQIKDSDSGASYTEISMADSDEINDIGVLEEIIRMVLEILNSTITHQVSQNPNLLYSILYKRKLFDQFSFYSNFDDVMHNIIIIINFLMHKLEGLQRDPSVGDVQAIIRDGILLLPSERLTKFPELKFKYVEENDPEEFFIPYIWNLINQYAGIAFDPNAITLFDSKFSA